ncbi:MAG: hypothetical protein V4619_17025 [Bacteroidota bacterium]
METIIEDTQLDNELQELYIISSHLNSDIEFVRDEIRFLKNALNKYHAYSDNLQTDETARFYKMLDVKDIMLPTLKNAVAAFLKLIRPFITHSKKEIGLEILEKFNELQTEIKHSVEYIKLVKKLVFAFIEDAIRAGRYAETPLVANLMTDKNRRSLSFML